MSSQKGDIYLNCGGGRMSERVLESYVHSHVSLIEQH